MALKALIVDDDPGMIELLCMILESYGIDVVAAEDGEQGTLLAQTENPDIIILDLMMPGQDGWDACKAIRSFSQAPITILSALNDPGIISSALDAGADDYLVKPVSGSVLVAHINKLTRRATVEQNSKTMMNQTGSLHLEQKAIQA